MVASIYFFEEKNMHWFIAGICGFFTGFLMGALELTIFAAIWADFEIKKENSSWDDEQKGAGELQKGCQSSEGVLEALPEVIMQSVFYMRSVSLHHHSNSFSVS